MWMPTQGLVLVATALITVSMLLLLIGLNASTRRETSPGRGHSMNIVFILTDDQDIYLGGQNPMKKTKQLIGDQGIIFTNAFVTSPLCCPSRSSILTGKYIHNHNAVNNSISGNCSSPAWQAGPEKHTFITYVKQRGYNTFFSGKYLNQYGKRAAGGVKHVPPGWDWWLGLVGNSRYYDYKLSVNGTKEKHGDVYEDDYLTDLINRKALEFLSYQTENTPFFMMLSTPACHAPFTPAPRYAQNFSDLGAPRLPNYNVHGSDKHWLIRAARNPMSKSSVNITDWAFRNRWRTLLSVDDMVEDVVNTLQQKGLLDNTYIFFTGDNGFHLGQFSLPIDKRQLYEFDIRVPLMVRGPGIAAGQVRQEAVLNIDLAPTFVELTGGQPAPDMDGVSMALWLRPGMDGVSMAPWLWSGMDGVSMAPWLPSGMDGVSMDPWLRSDQHSKAHPLYTEDVFLVEYYGESHDVIPGCPNLTNQSVANCQPDCVCEDAKNNTFHCVRKISGRTNTKYCELNDKEGFIEFYNLNSDPFEMKNTAKLLSPGVKESYSRAVSALAKCEGVSCRDLYRSQPS